MSAKNTKRFALVGMLAGAMILGGTQASAQTQSGAQGSTGATQAAPQATPPGGMDQGQAGNTAPFPENTNTPEQATPLPPDVIGQPGTGGSGGSGTLPSQDDAIDPARTNDSNTTLSPDSSRTGTGTSNGTLTPDTSRGTTNEPGTGGSGTLGQDDTLGGNNGLGTGGSDVNGSGKDQTTSPDSVYKGTVNSDDTTSVPRD
jgi:hypothetical protein